jgi:hypothetical protein
MKNVLLCDSKKKHWGISLLSCSVSLMSKPKFFSQLDSSSVNQIMNRTMPAQSLFPANWLSAIE